MESWQVIAIVVSFTAVILFAINRTAKPMATKEDVAVIAANLAALNTLIDEKFGSITRHIDDRIDGLEKRLTDKGVIGPSSGE